jgi:hypothetical protein
VALGLRLLTSPPARHDRHTPYRNAVLFGTSVHLCLACYRGG